MVAQQDLRPVLGGNVFLHRADERLDLSEGFAVCEPRPNLCQNALDLGAAINDEEPFRKPGNYAMPETIAENPCRAQDAETDQKIVATAVRLGFVSSTLTPSG